MQNIAAVALLAGGKSVRMGVPKSLLKYNGSTLINHHVKAVNKLNLPVLVCANDVEVAATITGDYTHIEDALAGQGPLAALAGAMRYAKASMLNTEQEADNKYLMVLSVDSLMMAGDLQKLLSKQNTLASGCAYAGADIIHLYDEQTGKDMPLLGLYRLCLCDELLAYLQSGERRVMQFIAKQRVSKVALPTSWHGLVNINTPKQWQHAIKHKSN